MLLATPTFASQPRIELITAGIKADLSAHHRVQFSELLRQWEVNYGTQAVEPLLKIAQDLRIEDTDRYVAIMGAAKLGGSNVASAMVPFLKDSSWMVRVATLRALIAIGTQQNATPILALLKDKALVVRSEAVLAIDKLRPPGSAEALIETLEFSGNYHGGRAQQVPQRALLALTRVADASFAPRLSPLLKHEQDPELQRATIQTLEKLMGGRSPASGTLREQVKAWQKRLAAR